jgi:hypothetical protein
MTDRTCATCEYRIPVINGDGGAGYCNGPQRERYDKLRGLHQVPATVEYERTRFWRWLGFNTCGPEGNYWYPAKPLGTPPSSIDD